MRRVPPAWLSDAVELWARSRGRHAKAFWSREMGFWLLEIEHKADHPDWLAYRSGERSTKPHEIVMLADPGDGGGMKPLDLNELGASGLTEWLEAADVMTGRGEYPNLHAAMRAVRESHQQLRDLRRAQMEEAGREIGWLHARSLAGTPYITVGVEVEP